ncbi:uncharacterized protein F5Z01DRAFT_672925 [Emericellopsis atlantica]|uniref:Zn(2)-C6 fungal-type domain-containing protein n=1 Tax=Emericellopsis atlantica TaxID=2614577 RepID=A0A9P7ZQ28_9HYPO|nr:uncharacterized protein F5Z01DRAFT_672925 [Emericellopsis atlantica]KAG9255620.1 hypothetical protein F5Z01DRAFT_672925 [Emericellopsis atlantica]
MPSVACDRCSKRKEKCLVDKDKKSCQRCEQQKVACLFERRPKRIGRRPTAKPLPYGLVDILNLDDAYAQEEPQQPQQVAPVSPPATSVTTPSPFLDPLSPAWPVGRQHTLPPDTTPRALVHAVLHDKDMFYTFHADFMIGSSFAPAFQRAIQSIAHSADAIVLSAYQTVFTLWDLEHQRIRPLGEVDISAGRDCLRVLQNANTVKPEDAAAILMVGQILLVYHIATICTSAQPILRSALLAVKSYYGDLLEQESLDPITVTPVWIDTVESLVRREIPIVNVATCDRFIVDRQLGLCWTLLPLLHKLCECSARSKAFGALFTAAAYGPLEDDVDDAFSEVEAQIRAWEPKPPVWFYTSFTPMETAAMLLQARVYRRAALLIIHRLRYPLGVRDEPVAGDAHMIVAEISGFMAWAPPEMKGLPVAFPLLVAMLEVKGLGMNIVPQLASFSRHPRHGVDFVRFVDLVWAAREGGFRGLWFDLATNFEMPVLP